MAEKVFLYIRPSGELGLISKKVSWVCRSVQTERDGKVLVIFWRQKFCPLTLLGPCVWVFIRVQATFLSLSLSNFCSLSYSYPSRRSEMNELTLLSLSPFLTHAIAGENSRTSGPKNLNLGPFSGQSRWKFGQGTHWEKRLLRTTISFSLPFFLSETENSVLRSALRLSCKMFGCCWPNIDFWPAACCCYWCYCWLARAILTARKKLAILPIGFHTKSHRQFGRSSLKERATCPW